MAGVGLVMYLAGYKPHMSLNNYVQALIIAAAAIYVLVCETGRLSD